MKLTTLLKEILDSNSVLDIKSTKTEDLNGKVNILKHMGMLEV
jgi:hypothetical protein